MECTLLCWKKDPVYDDAIAELLSFRHAIANQKMKFW
jgi:hypothetical protein